MADITLAEGAAPSTPSSGYVALYFKSDGLLYWKDDAGNEYAPVYSGGSASFVDLTVTGNTIIGNAIGDTLTVNAGAWTLSNAVTVTGAWANLGTVTTVDINGGTIDGAVIGGSSAAAGSFTTLSASGNVTLSATAAEIKKNDTANILQLCGGTTTGSDGGSLQLTGATNASANYAILNATTHLFRSVTGGATFATLSSTGLAVTGTVSASGPFIATGNTLTSSAAVWFGPDTVGGGAINVPTGENFLVLEAHSAIATFNSTGLSVTGAISGTTEVSAVEFQLTGIGSFSQGSLYLNATHGLIVGGKAGSTNDVYITNSGGTAAITVPTGTANVGIGGNLTVTGGTITTGSTTALSLATSGGTVASLINIASAVNYSELRAAATGGAPGIAARGSDTNVSYSYDTQGAGSHIFSTGTLAAQQVYITHTASANRYITLTGSNGGNPAISVSAGELAVGTNAWTFGVANSVSPTSPNRTLTVTIGGTTYYIAAKTTND